MVPGFPTGCISDNLSVSVYVLDFKFSGRCPRVMIFTGRYCGVLQSDLFAPPPPIQVAQLPPDIPKHKRNTETQLKGKVATAFEN